MNWTILSFQHLSLASITKRSLDTLRIFIAVGLCASFVIIAGCATGDSARCPETPEAPPFSRSGDLPADLCWWQSFDDEGLNGRISEAFAGSFTLEAALQRVCAARAVARREASDLFIDLDGVAGAGSSFGPGPDPTSL